MNLQLVGCSHHQSNLRLREQLAFRADQVPPFLDLFYERFPASEAVLLSTCNRTELYVTGREIEFLPRPDEMIGLLAEHREIREQGFQDSMFCHCDRQAIHHLFSVAASVDSMVVGEAQILSQVKQAYRIAVDARESISQTHHVFQAAIRAARRVARETDIHAKRVSIPSIAVGSLARRIFERLDNKRMLLIGAGKMAEETLRYLREQGGRDIVLVNRTESRAQELADAFDGTVARWEDLEHELTLADMIVSTTGASDPVVSMSMFERVEPHRHQRPLFILDLAIPRDFEPEIGDRLNVYLYSIDDLKSECDRNRKARESEWPKAEKILQQETDDFIRQMHRRKGGATIAQLKQQADAVKVAELDRLMNRVDGLTDQQRKEIEYSFNRVVNKILHPPMVSLNENSNDEEHSRGLLDALKRLFQLGD